MTKAKPVNAESWCTPDWLYGFLHEKYQFDLDIAASDQNHKCERYYTKENSAWGKEWSGNAFMNPPYGDKTGPSTADWVEEAHRQIVNSPKLKLIGSVIPFKPDTSYYHDLVKMGTLGLETRFTDPRGKIGIFQERFTDFLDIHVYEFRSRVPFVDEKGEKAGNGWFATLGLVYRKRQWNAK